MAYQMVIFDNDGTLVDSETTAHRVLSGFLTELGYPTTLEESFHYFLGNAGRNVHTVVADRYGGTLPEDFTARCHDRVFAAFDRGVVAAPGAAEVLAELGRREVRYCLASSSDHAWIDLTLDRSGLREHLPASVVFSAEDVAGVGKPAPDLFLHAARAMGVAPADCLVVEDSPNGVLAARAAGMDVLGYTALMPAERLAAVGATALIGTLRQVLDHVA
ncbi:hydrolase [Streptacidiphilus pinicola]|uniref:Hydrolase n=1 Tax=Streptacidiphilus pinicola TaxID=2219663 RepID=A0A2X0J6V5_9ACTN|nr:HAD family phosphatase [Streptacidiphilus pinicola]RAG85996.1 hydrolase [Streptacidiphilus pinicola]